MARQTTLSNVLSMLKGEIGYSLVSGVAAQQDQELYTLIDNKQKFFASEYDWPFLVKRQDTTVAAATRYINLPTLNFERPVIVEVFWSTFWRRLEYGIGAMEYNMFSSGDGSTVRTVDPPLRWQFYDETQYEVWPVPVSQFTVRFTGQRVLTDLKTSGSYDSAKTLDLDDLLLVYSVAADKLSRLKHQDAESMAAKMLERFNSVRGSYPIRKRTIRLGGKPEKIKQVIAIQVAAP